jgi:2-dehydro-3-deoxyglucarate aldolase
MRKTTLKKKLKSKELTIGSWLTWGYSQTAEIMAKRGFDWLVIDMEHTSIDYSEAQLLIQTIELAGCIPLVRVGANDPLIIKRVLDAGAQGIVVPMINTAEDAKKAVDAAYYPPLGSRGVGLSRAQDYGLGFDEYKQLSEAETVVIVQIEHIKGVQNLREILSVEGVDGFIIGPYDLSGSLKHPGDFRHPKVTEALKQVVRVMKSQKKPGGVHVVFTDQEELKKKVEEGYSFIAYGDDMVMFSEKISEESGIIREIR